MGVVYVLGALQEKLEPMKVATHIGADKKLVNSLGPLLGEKFSYIDATV